MFRRDHHLRVAAVLHALDGDLLRSHRCYFGGGTAMTLRYGEYRESIDIDFLVSDPAGYRGLRERVREGRFGALTTGPPPRQLRDIRTDRYGIRTLIEAGAAEIKFEVILEGRIELDEPGEDDRLCGVLALTPRDLAASKLLANSDRWADASVRSRDIIDLAMMRPSRELLRSAIVKASAAYGDSIERDLRRAFERLEERPQVLDDCMRAMKMTTVPKALLWSHIRELIQRLR